MQALLAGEVDAKTWVAKNPKKHPNYIGNGLAGNANANSTAGTLNNATLNAYTNMNVNINNTKDLGGSREPSRAAKMPETPRGMGSQLNPSKPSPRLEKFTGVSNTNASATDHAMHQRNVGGGDQNINNDTGGKFDVNALSFIQDPSFKEGLDAIAFSAMSRAIVEEVQSLIDRKISNMENHNRSLSSDENIEVARFQVYNQAFTKLISEFHVFRPLLSGIKAEYDTYIYKLQERVKKNEASKKAHNIDEEKDKLLLSIETKRAYENEIIHLKEEIKRLNVELHSSEERERIAWDTQSKMKAVFDDMVKENAECRQSMVGLSNALQRYEAEKKVLVERDQVQKVELIQLRQSNSKAVDECEKMQLILQEAEELQSTMVSIDVVMKKNARNQLLESEMAYYVELNRRILQRYSVLKSIIDGIEMVTEVSDENSHDSSGRHISVGNTPVVRPSSLLNERIGTTEINFNDVQKKALRIIKKGTETSQITTKKSDKNKNDTHNHHINPSHSTLLASAANSTPASSSILSRQIIEALVDCIEDLQNQVKKGILIDNFESWTRTNVHNHFADETEDRLFIPQLGNLLLAQDGQAWGNLSYTDADRGGATSRAASSPSNQQAGVPQIPDPNFVVPPLESPYRNFTGLGYAMSKKSLNPNLPTIAMNNAVDSLPPFLQTNGQVQNLFLTKREILAEVRDIWFVRTYITRVYGVGAYGAQVDGRSGSKSSEQRDHFPSVPSTSQGDRGNTASSNYPPNTTAQNNLRKSVYVKMADALYSEAVKNSSFADFVAIYLQFKYKERAIEMSYNIFHALHNFSNVSDCFLFLLIYKGEVSEDLYLDIHRILQKFHDALQKINPTDSTIPCELCIKTISRLLSIKVETTIAKFTKALNIEARGERIINFYSLLNDDTTIFDNIINPEEPGAESDKSTHTDLNHLSVVLREPVEKLKDRCLFLEILRYQLITDYLVFSNMAIEAITKLKAVATTRARTNSTFSSNSGHSGTTSVSGTAGGAEKTIAELSIPTEPHVSLKLLRETIQKIDPFKSRQDINTYLVCGTGLSVDDVLLFEANGREVPVDPFIKRLKKCLIKRSHATEGIKGP